MSTGDDRLERACALWLETGDLDEVRRRFPDLADEIAALAHTRRQVETFATPFGATITPPEIPGYRIVRPLGCGAFSIVYEAEQLSLKRHVALKVLFQSRQDPKATERFRREAIAVASLRHPAILAVYDHGEAAGTFFLAMELCGDHSLAEEIARQRNGPPRPPRTHAEFVLLASRFAWLADALAHAHDHQVLHRDLKPANVLVAQDQSLRLLDFGLASLVGGEQLTLSGQPIGSPQTMAPEQARGDRAAIGPWSDVFGLGATLYEALTLHPVFPGQGVAEVVAAVLAGSYQRPRTIDPSIPPALAAIVCTCLEHDPRLRYASAQALAADLRAFAAGAPVRASNARVLARAASLVRRRPLAVLATLVLLSTLLTLLSVWQRTRRAEQRSEHAESRSLEIEQRLRTRIVQDRILDLLNRVYRLGSATRPNAGVELEDIAVERRTLDGDPETEVLFAYALWCFNRFEEAGAVLDGSQAARELPEGHLLSIHLGPPGLGAAAVEHWRRAEDRTIQTPLACYLAGQYLLKCDPVGAVQYLERGRAHPSIAMHYFIGIQQSLVEARSRLGLYEAALRDAQMVKGTQGDDPRTLACMASLLARLGRTGEADSQLAQTIAALIDRDALRSTVCQLLLNVDDLRLARELLGPQPGDERAAGWYRVALECRLQSPPADDDGEFARAAVRNSRGDGRVTTAAARLLLERRDAACLRLFDRSGETGAHTVHASGMRLVAGGILEGGVSDADLLADCRDRGLPEPDTARLLAIWQLLRGQPLAAVEPLLVRASEHLPSLPSLRLRPPDPVATGPRLSTVDLAGMPAVERDRRAFGVLDLMLRNGNRFSALVAAHAALQKRVRASL